MYYILTAVVFYIAGCITLFFVMKNNPKYFDLKTIVKKLSQLSKAELQTLKAEAEALLAKV